MMPVLGKAPRRPSAAKEPMLKKPYFLFLFSFADGYGFITALRALNSDLSLIPVILLTARAGEDENVKGLLHGAEGVC